MKQTIISVFAVVVAVVLLAGAFLLWRQRPWRVAAAVNGRVLTAAALDLRARADLDDAKRLGRLAFPASKEAEALAHFRREHAKLWILKEVILSEAVARNTGVGADDEAQEYERLSKRLKEFGLTLDDYLKGGPIPEEQKRQDVRETILMRNFTDGVILPKIKIETKDIDARFAEMQRKALVTTKPGEQPKEKPSPPPRIQVDGQLEHYGRRARLHGEEARCVLGPVEAVDGRRRMRRAELCGRDGA